MHSPLTIVLRLGGGEYACKLLLAISCWPNFESARLAGLPQGPRSDWAASEFSLAESNEGSS